MPEEEKTRSSHHGRFDEAALRKQLERAGISGVDALVAKASQHVRQQGGGDENLYIFASSWFFFITPY